jgi:hypothetical protein
MSIAYTVLLVERNGIDASEYIDNPYCLNYGAAIK